MNWMGDLKDYLLSIKNRHDLIEGSCRHNVIGVDWSEGAKTAFYPQAVANTQLVGAIVAKFIKDLISVHRTTPDRFTIVGHSLGAHTSGFVGTHFKKPNQIKLIIGLDPAGPGFHDVPNTHRLDPSDGKLVLTLHTNGGKIIGDSFGIKESLGHYSFWPNGGSDQPGCEVTRGISNILLEGLFTGLSNTIACSHRRATILVQFNESLLTTAQSMAYTCEDYEKFGEGQCGNCLANPNGCKPFGSWFDFWHQYQLPSNWSKPVNYFIDTTDSKPYTTYHHQMVVRTKPSFSSFLGYIKVTPIGEKRDAEQIKIDPGRVKPNSTYTYLIKVPKSLGNIDKALVRIKNDGIANSLVKAVGFQGESFNPMQVIEEIRFNFMSNEDLA
ncbi:PREDICTED: pancreatic lipase-related protein 2-like [Rhagoletis zephyria]|uniref:pancreatic lipase-related protein 2-like n=1 Tax=Rhagoletis zephyria TaxID=28612 RepID=UPI0008114974|nr:PREDICTED: pancreatic lipase-related protein 2-like [Rhagoletis zephyria]